MLKMTAELLAELGSCGDYTAKFKRMFPTTDERYEDGVEVTSEVVRANERHFDLSWAVARMFNDEAQTRYANATYGRDEVSQLIETERTQATTAHHAARAAWRQKYDLDSWSSGDSPDSRQEYQEEGERYRQVMRDLDERSTAHWTDLFAELFNDPSCHSQTFMNVQARAEERRSQAEADRLHRFENKLRTQQEKIRYWTEEPENELRRVVEELEAQRSNLAERIEEQRRYWAEEPSKKIEEHQAEVAKLEGKIANLRPRVARRQLAQLEARVEAANQAALTAQQEVERSQQALETARQHAVAVVAEPIAD